MRSRHDYSSDKQLKIFEAEGNVEVKKYDKVGSYELTTIKEVALPDWYLNEDLKEKILVRFACYCALEVIDIFEEKYPNDNGPRKAIEEAMKYGSDEFDRNTTDDAAYTAYAAVDADDIVYAAAAAADAAVYTDDAVYTAAAVYTNDTAHAAANAAARAANAADINITKLMKKAINDFV